MKCRSPQFDPWVEKRPWRRHRLPTPVFVGFPGDPDSKESTCNSGYLSLISGLGRPPGGGHRNPTPVFLPGESPQSKQPSGLQSRGHKESDMTE